MAGCVYVLSVRGSVHPLTDPGSLVPDWKATTLKGHRQVLQEVPTEEQHRTKGPSQACCARSPTYHPYGSRWSPPCAPRTRAQPATPGWWRLCQSGHHGESHRCTASAWCLVARSLSFHRSRRCSIWSHSSPPWRWLWRISGLQGNKKMHTAYLHCGTSELLG